MSKWIEKRTRPVLPLYLAALTWPVASLILPPYRLVNLVIIAALSTVVYLVSSRFCPTRVPVSYTHLTLPTILRV